jgi:hypothetical protein
MLHINPETRLDHLPKLALTDCALFKVRSVWPFVLCHNQSSQHFLVLLLEQAFPLLSLQIFALLLNEQSS